MSIPDAVLAEMVSDARPEDARWSQVEMLLSAVADLQQQILHVLIAANGGTPPEFRPIRRPGHVPSEGRRQPETPDEKAERRAAMRARIDGTGSAPT
ncbi:hypothetical protein ACFRCG_41885 [Embleya sp. NPDC056575]|uniref:hypothetical protein n=1 Tax=unclassified Embleya TaxID=2699296 RepID=UPI0036B9171B